MFVSRVEKLLSRSAVQEYTRPMCRYFSEEMMQAAEKEAQEALSFGLNLPQGSTLSTLEESNMVYIDKSEMIYELQSSNLYSVITRPRRFGKTIFLSTISAIATKDPIIKTLAIKHRYASLKNTQ